ncbi:MAG: hypothetical protein QXH42_02165 [Thermoplasmata archaeon]
MNAGPRPAAPWESARTDQAVASGERPRPRLPTSGSSLLPADRLACLVRELSTGRKLLVTTSPRLLNLVSLYVVCYLQRQPGSVLFISVDRPKGYMLKMVERYCPASGKVVWRDYTMLNQARVSHVAGLFAPKLLLDALDHLSRVESGETSVVVSNVSALTYYNSNDRVREFLAALSREVDEGRIKKIAIIMDGQGQYIYNEAKIFTEKSVDVGW